jgi:hypothetical protein
MKIEVEVPDEFVKENNNLFLFSGMNHIAVKRPGKLWVVKTSGCNMCGSCCQATHIAGMNLPMKDNACAFLIPHPKDSDKLICNWRGNRPFSCCIGSPIFEPNCTIRWEFAK